MQIHCIITVFNQGGSDQLAALIAGLGSGKPCYCEPGTDIFKISPGLVLQVCGASVPPPAYLTDPNLPLVSFAVPDVEAAMAKARALGATVLAQTTDQITNFRLFHVRLADGRIIGFFSV